jgi:hypothetical protein
VLESVAAVVAATLSLASPTVVMDGPVTAVATEGQWTAIVEGTSGHDCDRISIWSIRVYRLDRPTGCTAPGHRIATLSEIDNRAVWLHVRGGQTRTWTLWTATTTSPSPQLLASAKSAPAEPVPIVLGPGTMDRSQGFYGEGDVLPYAIGREVTVLRSDGGRSLRWTAPARVVGFASASEVLIVALADRSLVMWELTYEGKWKQSHVLHAGGVPARIAYDDYTVLVQYGRHLQSLPFGSSGSAFTRTLAPGERLVGGSAGRIVLATGRNFRVQSAYGRVDATSTATALSLDSNHYVAAAGRRVTRYQLPG